jgi:hypothetical protein
MKGLAGVTYLKKSSRYKVNIGYKSENIHIGYFSNLLDAASARKSAELKYINLVALRNLYIGRPITQAMLREVVTYDPNSGLFSRKVNLSNACNEIIGTIGKQGYLVINILGDRWLAHRLAFLYMTGRFPENEIDHINHNRLDNRWSNLRACTSSENNMNMTIAKNNQTGCTGVSYYSKYGKKYRVTITTKRKQVNIGYFSDFFEACCSRKSAELKYGYHKNHGMTRKL